MVKVTFMPSGKTIEVKPRTNLMQAIIDADLPIGRSCNAQGICTKCLVIVHEGAENLSAPNILERKLKEKEKFADNMRVSCQTKILGPITISTTYW